VAIEHFARAMRLSPLDPVISYAQVGTAHAHFFAGRYDEASSWARMSLREWPDGLPALRITAASDAFAGRLDDAERTMAHMRQIDPTRSISNLADALGPYRPEELARLTEGLRKAGLPE
jgi:adenylate cyclase